jgi:Leucine-rich repeat (LRR) protein
LIDEEILELSGETALEDVRGLTLRGRNLSTFDSHAGRLPSLEALSLSGNQLTSLSSFTALTSLRTLNVNSNQLTSLHGLQACQALQQLYAGANKLRDIQPLAGLQNLSTLHLFSNAISALDLTVEVS